MSRTITETDIGGGHRGPILVGPEHGHRARVVVWMHDGQEMLRHQLWRGVPPWVALVGLPSNPATRTSDYVHACDEEINVARGWDTARATNAMRYDVAAAWRRLGVEPNAKHIITGVSCGGLQAMLCAIESCRDGFAGAASPLWDGVLAMSPAVGWAHLTDPITKHWRRTSTPLYIDSGDTLERLNDNRWAVQWFEREVRPHGCPIDEAWYVGEEHNWVAWEYRFPFALERTLRLIDSHA